MYIHGKTFQLCGSHFLRQYEFICNANKYHEFRSETLFQIESLDISSCEMERDKQKLRKS